MVEEEELDVELDDEEVVDEDEEDDDDEKAGGGIAVPPPPPNMLEEASMPEGYATEAEGDDELKPPPDAEDAGRSRRWPMSIRDEDRGKRAPKGF